MDLDVSPIRICYVNINEELPSRQFLTLARKAFDRCCEPHTTVTVNSVSPGLTRATQVAYPYLLFLNKQPIIEAIIEAENEGFDAVVVGCFFDPAIEESRAVVDIPVVGLAESSLGLACQMGGRFAIITTHNRRVNIMVEEVIDRLGLRHRAIAPAVRGIEMSDALLYTRGMREPGTVVADVAARAEIAQAEGAEVIVIGCNALGPLCTLERLTRTRDGSAPIIDCVAAAVKHSEMLVSLCRRTGLPPLSRVGRYGRPQAAEVNRVRKHFGLERQAGAANQRDPSYSLDHEESIVR